MAYAVDEMASEANTGSANFFGSRSCISSAVAIGWPSRARLIMDAAPNRHLSHSSLDPPFA